MKNTFHTGVEINMNDKIIIICESMYHNNTIKLAKAMTVKLNCKVIGYDEALKADLSKYSVVGLGSGIFFTSHHPKLIEAAKKLTSSQYAFLFSTHGAPFLGKYHNAIKKSLAENNVKILGDFSCKGYDGTGPFLIAHGGNKGRPNENDCLRAEKFIKKILPEYYIDTEIVHNGKYVDVKKDKCIGCGKCIKVCPMKVFEIKEEASFPVNAIECTHCLLCIENCPTASISVHHTYIEAIAIAKRHAKRTSL